MGIDVTQDAEKVPVETRRKIARVEGGKLFDVNMALGRRRRISTRVLDERVVLQRAVNQASKEADKAERAVAREVARAARAKAKAEALAEKRRAAKPAASKRKKGAGPEYPSQSLPKLSAIRCVAPFEWLPAALKAAAEKQRRDMAFVIREAVQAEVVAKEMKSIEPVEHGGVLISAFIAPTRVPADEQHLLAAIDKTAKRLTVKLDAKVKSADVVRTALARWLRARGFGTK